MPHRTLHTYLAFLWRERLSLLSPSSLPLYPSLSHLFMANYSQPPSKELRSIFGVTKGAFFHVYKVYKSLIRRIHFHKNSSPKRPKVVQPKVDEDPHDKALDNKKKEEEIINIFHDFSLNGDELGGGVDPTMPRGSYKHKSMDNSSTCIPSPLSRSASRRSHTGQTSHLESMGRKSVDSAALAASLSKSASRKSSNHIMFSNSNGLIKPPATEKTLECTLEELCFGCVKKIKVTRDVATSTGQIVEEEEYLTIKVKPGWKKGTKITFEGMGDERPGTEPADINFLIAEKRHPVFRREGDDLELAVEIPLVKAVTGCTISIPLLGGDGMNLSIDDIIYPGYEKIIAGQGMPIANNLGMRGNLRLVFLIDFPTELTEEQRSDAFSILSDSC